MAMPHIPEICQEDFESMVEVNSELSIEVVNHVIELMNDEFNWTPKMFFCSDIYYRRDLPAKIRKQTDFVQIHFIDKPNCHYLISCQINGRISIYDSVVNEQHVSYLLPQLKIVYEDVNENELQYKVPQTQGNEDLNLCGFFAVANAISLLNGEVPESRPLNKSLMRSHLRKCINDKKLRLFPQCRDVFKNTSQGRDSLKVREGIHSPSEQQKALISNMKVKLSLTSEADSNKFKHVEGTDLEFLMECCSRNWFHLALFVLMPVSIFLNNITARHKVLTYFTVVKEMIKEEKYPKFDVVLLDLLHRIYLLMKTGINWEALKNNLLSLSKTGCISDEDILTVFKVVNNFDIAWAIFKMPHLNVKERLRRFKLSEDNLDEIDLALCALNEEIEKLNVYEEKIAKFFRHKVLINIIRNSSTARQELLERIDKFSKIKVNFKLVQKKNGCLGVPEGMEHMMLHDINADILDIDKEYVLKNDYMIGESVESWLGKGTLGWIIKDKSGIQSLSTSLHIMFNSDRMKMLAKDYNGYMDHKTLPHSCFCGSWFEILYPFKLDCYISSDRSLYEICKAIYKQGCNAEARLDDKGTVEIALLRMKKGGSGKKKEEECLIKKNMLQQWIDLKLPQVLSFNGTCLDYCKGMQVLKIGNKTGITKATIAETDVDVSCPMPDGNYRIELKYQIAVQWIADNPFSTEGDSGAPVFFLGESGEMFAVGMVSASQKQNRRSIITPIGAILNACGGSLASFKIILEEKS